MFIEAKEIVKDYSGHRALDGLNISVPEGSIYGLLGPNGAGKTTFIRILNQMTRPDSGSVLLDGHPLRPDDISQIGYLPQDRGLYRKMKVGEEAIYLARLKGLSKADASARLKIWFEKFGIMEWWNKKVEELSKGMAQKVQFIVTVLHEPRLLIFDEPFSGFDPVNANILKEEILNLKNNGATVLFSTHNMASVEEICDEITLINRSRAVLSGAVYDVKQRFKENAFKIKYTGDASQLSSPDSQLSISDFQSEGAYNTAVVRPREENNMPANDIIRYLLEKVNLCGFEEILPSMNDIFIKIITSK